MFKTPKCHVCTMEHLFILRPSKTANLVNYRSKIYRAYKQNPKLHRFNTDDPLGEKVKMDQPARAKSTKFTFNPAGQTPAASPSLRWHTLNQTSALWLASPRQYNA
eukprot:10653255-Ditylum_brightwellii.AAC.1